MRRDDEERKAEIAEIARRFKRLRRRSLLTQRRLARLIGICRQAVSDIERQRVMPHFSTCDRFAALEAKHMQPRIKFPAHWE